MRNRTELLKFVRETAINYFHVPKEKLEEDLKSTVGIAYYIARVAHDGVERDNGTPYMCHPLRMYERFGRLLCINDENFDIDDCMLLYKIPFYGVQEVCLLHDVIEDWMAKIEDIEEMYEDLGYKDYFEMYIKEPLQYITHDKSVDYETYIDIVLKNPTSALVKLLDLNDNIDIFGLGNYGEKEDERIHRYIKYRKMINDKYHFVERIASYRKECIYPDDTHASA